MAESLRSARIRATTIGDLLLTSADAHPQADAIVFPDARLSYAELVKRALLRARSLQALGIKRREHVGLLLPTGFDFVELFFAISFCGAVAVPINARYRPGELAYVIDNGDLVTVLTTDRIADKVNFVERLAEALPGLASSANPAKLALRATAKLRNVVVLGDSKPAGCVDAERFTAGAETVTEDDVHRTRLRVRLRDVGIMLYTSGTTSNPKGCLITHEAMVRNSIALGRHRYRLTQTDRFWSPLPMFHIAAILPMLAILDLGGAYLTMSYFDAGAALKMLARDRATATYPCFVTIMSDLIHHPDFAHTDLSRVRLMNSNFAVQPPGIAAAMRKAMPDAIQVGTFGMTEAAGTVSTSSPDEPLESRITRLGTPLPGLEVRILDSESGSEAAIGARGEVLVRGYSLFEGYYKDAEKTALALDADGWFHTADIGSVDAAGTILFHGRIKDMLKVGGENVAAAEIEGCLVRHPGVKLAQVVGIPDQRLVEVPAAFVERKADSQVTAQELIDFCRKEIAGFKVPRHVRFVTEWPMSASKIQKFRLRDELVRDLETKAS